MTFIFFLRKTLKIIIYLSIIVELCIFPSWKNLCGCLMAFICWLIFDTFFLKRDIICRYPFAFIMFISMFLYRYLPLPVTLIEGKPITYGLALPYHTFFLETILFIFSSIAFYFSFNHKGKNNRLQIALYKIGFFKGYSATVIWGLGLIGLTARIATFSTGDIEYGNIGGKLLSGLVYLMYTPFILFFPRLYPTVSPNNAKKTILYTYFVCITLLGIAGNSRQSMIAAFALIILLYLLQLSVSNYTLKKFISLPKIILLALSSYIILNIFSDLSLAILYNRNIRTEVNKEKLLRQTIETYQNKEVMELLRKVYNKDVNKRLTPYTVGWDETYVDNFLLNRYCNIRITDQTLFYAFKLDKDKRGKMQEDLLKKTISTLPTPALSFLGIELDKNDLEYSRGDILYALGSNSNIQPGFRVTSHIGDGIATFGLITYLILQSILFWIIFKLLNSLVIYKRSQTTYSLFGLISLFIFMGMFRNAQGIYMDITYCIRGFWQNIIIFIFCIFIIRKILKGLQFFSKESYSSL